MLAGRTGLRIGRLALNRAREVGVGPDRLRGDDARMAPSFVHSQHRTNGQVGDRFLDRRREAKRAWRRLVAATVLAATALMVGTAPAVTQQNGGETDGSGTGPAAGQVRNEGETGPGTGSAQGPVYGFSELRFVNPRARIGLPEPMPGPVIRFVVADDFPPFAFIDGAGRLAGVHVDLIRRICAALDLACTLQARRFDRVPAAADDDPTNLVLAAGLAVSEATAERFAFSRPYYRFAARFLAAEGVEHGEDWRETATIGVVDGTAHAAYLRAAFPEAETLGFADAETLFRAVRQGEVTHAFGDGIDLAFWLASERAGGCCRLVGAPIFSAPFFGEGLAFAVPHGQAQLVQALDAALARLEGSGELETLMLTAFPLDPLGL